MVSELRWENLSLLQKKSLKKTIFTYGGSVVGLDCYKWYGSVVGLDYYKWYQSYTLGSMSARTLGPKGVNCEIPLN